MLTAYRPVSVAQKTVFKLVRLAIIILLIGAVISCSQKKSHLYDIVKVSAIEETSLNNFSKSWCAYSIYADSANSGAVLLQEGDVVYIDGLFWDYYQKLNTAEYKINANDSLLFINDKLASIWISPKDKTLPVMAQMSDSDIKELRSLVFDDEIPGDYLPYIEKIASLNKNIGLNVTLNKATKPIVAMFDPLWMCLEITQQDFDFLTSLSHTKTLVLGVGDSVISEALPHMPELEHLIMSGSEFDDEIIDDFLANNQQIRKVTFNNCDLSNLSMIKDLNNLKSLSIFDDSDGILLNLEDLKTFDQLEALSLFIAPDNSDYIESLKELSSLRWLAVPPEITQDDFNAIIQNNKDLEVLELLLCENVTDLSTLTNLPNLTGLVVSDSLYDRTTPTTLSQLKYLSIPFETYKDSIYIASLQKVLPDCTIVPNEGFCLGSGWLFLLFPLILLFVLGKKNFSTNKTA